MLKLYFFSKLYSGVYNVLTSILAKMIMKKCTTQLLTQLRQLMVDTKYVKQPLQAYIIPWADAHNSEYVAPCDQQRAFISGFTGSAGTAIVTLKEALLWTDGRYYLQASQELDENWTLMKESLPETPSQVSVTVDIIERHFQSSLLFFISYDF